MNARRHAAERRRLELAERIALQRLKLRLQATVLAARHPWLGWAATPGWQRTALLAGGAAAAGAALLLRRQVLTGAAPAWRVAGLAVRCWLVGRLGWQLAASWRASRQPPTSESILTPKAVP